MERKNDSWRLKKMFCPNCSSPVMGYTDKNGIVHMTCPKCKAILGRRFMGRRHVRIEVYAPDGAEFSE